MLRSAARIMPQAVTTVSVAVTACCGKGTTSWPRRSTFAAYTFTAAVSTCCNVFSEIASGSPRLSASRAAAQKSADFTPLRATRRPGLPPRLAALRCTAFGIYFNSSRHRLAPRRRLIRLGLELLVLWHFEVEQACRIKAKDVALGLLVEERQRGDRVRQVEIPVRPIRREQKLRLGLHRLEGRFGQLDVGTLQRLARIIHLLHVLARLALEQRRFRGAHHVFGIEPLHQERDPGESALDPHHFELRESLR